MIRRSTDQTPAVVSCEKMLGKVLLNREPSVLTTPMMAAEMPTAMTPYSIAVATDSSLAKSPKKSCQGMLLLLRLVLESDRDQTGETVLLPS